MISVNGDELGGSSGSVTAADITDSTSVGRSVLTATDAAAARAALGFYPRVRTPPWTYPWTLPDAHTLAQVVPTGAQGATSFTDLSANARTVTASSAIVDTTVEGITSTPLYCPAGYLSVDHAG
ncbi:MAG: hypothetical protein IPQ07_40990, partial [Myxococcales bacterium]|nr:hypothetical protein [Myxococcales bacterium]